jgi:hypothetical protein
MLKIRRYKARDNERVKELYYAGNTQMVDTLPQAGRKKYFSSAGLPITFHYIDEAGHAGPARTGFEG